MLKLAGFINCILELNIQMHRGCWDEVVFGWNTGLRMRIEKVQPSFGIVLVWERVSNLKICCTMSVFWSGYMLDFSYDKIEQELLFSFLTEAITGN